MPEMVEIPLADLMLDHRNARLKDEPASEQAAALALAKQQGNLLVNLAEDIVRNGLDPTTLPCVIATGDQRKRYVVIEGNRRVLAAKALDTPSLIAPALEPAAQKHLAKLADLYAKAPIHDVRCVLFDEESQARHWIELRHTGQNDGRGLVRWGADEKDRFIARHGSRSPAGVVLDFVEKHGSLSEQARASKRGILTSLTRLVNTPTVRERLGIELVRGELYSRFSAQEVAKGLSRVVEDLKTGRLSVSQIYHADDRERYATSLPSTELPSPSKSLTDTVLLSDLAAGAPQPRSKPRRATRRRSPRERTALIAKECQLNIADPRINTIYNELLTANVDQYPNICSVGLRVFLELSVDHYLEAQKQMGYQERRSTKLAKRMKVAAAHLQAQGKIDRQLEKAVERMADSAASSLAASTPTFNMYVHNKFVYPRPSELRTQWDELQPFLEALWP